MQPQPVDEHLAYLCTWVSTFIFRIDQTTTMRHIMLDNIIDFPVLFYVVSNSYRNHRQNLANIQRVACVRRPLSRILDSNSRGKAYRLID